MCEREKEAERVGEWESETKQKLKFNLVLVSLQFPHLFMNRKMYNSRNTQVK